MLPLRMSGNSDASTASFSYPTPWRGKGKCPWLASVTTPPTIGKMWSFRSMNSPSDSSGRYRSGLPPRPALSRAFLAVFIADDICVNSWSSYCVRTCSPLTKSFAAALTQMAVKLHQLSTASSA